MISKKYNQSGVHGEDRENSSIFAEVFLYIKYLARVIAGWQLVPVGTCNKVLQSNSVE